MKCQILECDELLTCQHLWVEDVDVVLLVVVVSKMVAGMDVRLGTVHVAVAGVVLPLPLPRRRPQLGCWCRGDDSSDDEVAQGGRS